MLRYSTGLYTTPAQIPFVCRNGRTGRVGFSYTSQRKVFTVRRAMPTGVQHSRRGGNSHLGTYAPRRPLTPQPGSAKTIEHEHSTVPRKEGARGWKEGAKMNAKGRTPFSNSHQLNWRQRLLEAHMRMVKTSPSTRTTYFSKLQSEDSCITFPEARHWSQSGRKRGCETASQA